MKGQNSRVTRIAAIAGYFLVVAVLLCSFETVFADSYGPGRVELQVLAGRDCTDAGFGGIWNSQTELYIQIEPTGGWRIKKIQIFSAATPIPTTTSGNPIIGKFPYKAEYESPYIKDYDDGHIFRRTLVLDLQNDLDFRWGMAYEDMRIQNVAVHLDLVKLDDTGAVVAEQGAWAIPDVPIEDIFSDVMATEEGEVEANTPDTSDVMVIETYDDEKNKEHKVAKHEHQKTTQNEVSLEVIEVEEFLGSRWGWWFRYELAHPKRAHFIDSAVAGLKVETPTFVGITDDSGAFDYFPGERTEISIGSMIIGTALAETKVTPLDVFETADIDDDRVANLARLLQSLDSDGDPKQKITITADVSAAFESAMQVLDLNSVNFADDNEVNSIIEETIQQSEGMEGLNLVAVAKEDARVHLEQNISSTMFRKNVSRTPEMASAKAKLNIMGVWLPALRANGEPATYIGDSGSVVEGIPYYDEDGNLIRVATEAKPLVVIYCDEVPETGAHDVFASISRDDGNTWKRKNISRMADRSSFTLADGVTEYYGHCKKPVFQVKGNKILVTWTSKFARGGKPRYAIVADDPATPDIDEGDGYIYDDPYYTDDIWGVSGPQDSVDYTEQGYPEVGEVPYSAVWVARAVILTASDLTKAPWNAIGADGSPLYSVGEIVWFKPERLTSARRDANQIFCGGADGAGFAIAWQEDPEGLRPGEAKGPGPGWGGATTNHKTDIWYSYVTWADFAKVDIFFEPGSDSDHFDEDFIGRPKALVPMSLPVRLSDNDVVNTDNMWVELGGDGLPVLDGEGNFIPVFNDETQSEEDSDGSHRYGYMVEGLWNWNGTIYYEGQTVDWQEGDGGTLYQFINQQDELKTVVVTADGRPLDGDTGAARPNLFLQTYTKPDGTKSAWAIMAYEETKGVGLGPPEETATSVEPQDGSGYDPCETFPDEGKNAIYHSFDFQNPDLVSAGTILNLPETEVDENGVQILDSNGSPIPVYVTEVPCFGSDENGNCIVNPAAGDLILDWKGDPILAYENARRPRFILQSKAAAFGGTKTLPDGTVVFKEPDNSGTVLIVLYKEGQEGAGRPSDIMARRCVVKNTDGTIRGGNPWNPANFLPHDEFDTRAAVQNVSTVTPLETWINPDRDLEAKGDGVKVCTWEQPESNLALKSGVNPYEDARAHRGQIRGDFVIMGYSFTPNWAASRNAHDKYDFYIRRSFNGGETWTTDPASTVPVVHTDIFIDPTGVSGAELDEEGNDETEATKHYEVITEYAPGAYEPARNVSLIKNNKTSVIEPRIVAVPGTIKDPATKLWTGIPEDKQNRNVFYLAYGTSTNLPDVEKAPEDLFFSFSMDKGTALIEEEWVVNPDSEGSYPGVTVTGWYRLAKGDQEQGEVQLRMTPDGSRFYACWLDEGEEGSDILFRRIMDSAFAANVAGTVAETTVASVEDESADAVDEDFGSDDGDGTSDGDY